MSEGNYARHLETVAVVHLRSVLGPTATVEHIGGSSGADFTINYDDGTEAIGEVKALIDPAYEADWAAVRASGNPQRIPLRPGAGRWSVGLVPGWDLRHLTRQLPDLVEALVQQDLDRLSIYPDWPNDQLSLDLRRLGVSHLSRVDVRGDEAIYFLPIASSVVPLTNDAVASINDVLWEPKNRHSWERLVTENVDERHIFIWLSSGTPAPTRMFHSFHPEVAPDGQPQAPEWLTHLWVEPDLSFAGKRFLWGWQPETGWAALPLVTTESIDGRPD